MVIRIDWPGDPAASLDADGIRAATWSAPAGTVFGEHRHPYPKRLYVVAGAISFGDLLVRCGEGIRIDAGTDHSAVVGAEGVTCIEGFET